MDLIERLENYRKEEQKLAWQGTFSQYFDLVIANPKIAQLSHARLYDMIMSAGSHVGKNDEKVYDFFARDLFGLESTLQQLVEYFNSAARRLEVRKRILLMMGPVGGGKSTIVTLLKRGLEEYSRTETGAIYSIKGCPMHEEPLHLIPDSLRADIEKEYGIYVEGDLCPVCRQNLRDLYGGKMEDVLVERISLAEKNRTGIGTFTPSDPKSQDISELTGSIDLSTIGEYGVESDPRAYRFDGELNIANRGMMEFI
jgi:serine protein kinase